MIDPQQILAGALTGFLVGLTGVGGGALMTPILLLFFGSAPLTAVATDLWFAAITKTVAARIHLRAERVDWQVLRRLWAGSLPAALAMVLLAVAGAGRGHVAWLGRAIGAVVLVTALGLLFAPRLAAIARARRLGHPADFKRLQPRLTVLAGLLLGVVVSLTSIGAGTLGTVLLVYLYPLRMTPVRLVATDIVHAIPLAALAGLGYLFAGKVDGALLLNLLIGSLPAVLVGSRLAGRLPGRWLQVCLSFVLLATGARLLA
jgi:uncharacterized membrane protein YfcA